MLPILNHHHQVSDLIVSFGDCLKSSGFLGDICFDLAERYVHSVDNSFYQIIPSGVIYPKTVGDLSLVFKLLTQNSFRDVSIHCKGGGTSTNGQSIGSGIVLDCSKYLNNINHLDPDNLTVEVQSGVVLDQLNTYLNKLGFSFAATTSSSSRVTIGGMVATDAAGIGSRVYGKTSDNLISCELVVLGGDVLTFSSNHRCDDYDWSNSKDQFIIRLLKLLDNIKKYNSLKILSSFNDMPRFFSGFNLKKICKLDDSFSSEESSSFDLQSLLCGSEGVLGAISRIKLKIIPLQSFENLVLCFFDDFRSGTLEHCRVFLDYDPTAMEIVDNNLFNAFFGDKSFKGSFLSEYFAKTKIEDQCLKSLSCLMVSFRDCGDHRSQKKAQKLIDDLVCLEKNSDNFKVIDGPLCSLSNYICYVSSSDPQIISELWGLRKKAVGLFNNTGSLSQDGLAWYKSISFVEDLAVDPQHIVGFIKEFMDILDSYNLEYALYGHVDVGCVHVRPKLDVFDPNLKTLVRKISDQAFELCVKYRGVLWGEHGKGFRSEYLKDYFGSDLYRAFSQIKKHFDPFYQLNPGKICSPDPNDTMQGYKIDQLPYRYDHDQRLSVDYRRVLEHGLACDGNGLCFSDNPKIVMCPSYQVTMSRVHSPKGRAMLIKAWGLMLQEKGFVIGDYLLSTGGDHQKVEVISDKPWSLACFFGYFNINNLKKLHPNRSTSTTVDQFESTQDFSREVYNAMHGCLSCKGCSFSCPLGVDIPEQKSRFLYLYHQRYRRPMRDYLIAYSEHLIPFVARFNLLTAGFNYVNSLVITKKIIKRVFGLVDLPKIESFKQSYGSDFSNDQRSLNNIQNTSKGKDKGKDKQVSNLNNYVVVSEDLNNYFDQEDIVGDLCGIFEYFSIKTLIERCKPSGKSIHVRGFLKFFFRYGKVRIKEFNKFILKKFSGHKSSQPIYIDWVGIDPAFCLVYRQEYYHYGLIGDNSCENKNKNLSLSTHHPWLVSEYLVKKLCEQRVGENINHQFRAIKNKYKIYILLHCQEQAQELSVKGSWREVFNLLGIDVELVQLGCCGMAGFWGYQREYSKLSKDIFNMHWGPWLSKLGQSNDLDDDKYYHKSTVVLVTGGSCKKQIERMKKRSKGFSNLLITNPISFLNKIIKEL